MERKANQTYIIYRLTKTYLHDGLCTSKVQLAAKLRTKNTKNVCDTYGLRLASKTLSSQSRNGMHLNAISWW